MSAPQEFIVSNTGSGILTIDAVTLAGDDAGAYILTDDNTYPAELGTGEEIAVEVVFAPLNEGIKSANLAVEFNDGEEDEFHVELTGEGFDATVDEFPWLEDFEGEEFPPLGWSRINVSGVQEWILSTAQNHTPDGSQSAFHNYGPSGVDQEGWLITPPIELPADDVYELSFWSYNSFPTWYGKNSVLISAGSNDPADGDFVEVWTAESVTASWEEALLSLEDYLGETIFIAFLYEGDDAHAWYLDDVAIYEEPESLPLSFEEGFTWFSANVMPANMMDRSAMDVNAFFADLEPCDDDRIIAQTEFAIYYDDRWMPSIELDPKQRYVMELCDAQDLLIRGDAVPIEPIDLVSGFTWAGYLPQGCLTVEDAMASIENDLTAGDRVIGHEAFAEYSETDGWNGSLEYMCPGQGYVIDVAQATTLMYPEDGAFVDPPADPDKGSPAGIKTLANLKHTMTMVAQLQLADGRISLNPDDVVYAFVNDEARGMARPADKDNGFIFMSIGSNIEAGETVHFRVWLDELQELVDVRETITYESLQAVGSMQQPFTLTLGDPLSDDAIDMEGTAIGDAYPNPFNNTTHIPYTITEAADVTLRVYNAAGQLIHQEEASHHQAGSHEISFDRGNHVPGLYFYRVDVQQAGSELQKTGRMVIVE